MSEHSVINLKHTLKARQLMESFDLNLNRLQTQGPDEVEDEANTIDLLSEWLEEAIENGMEVVELQPRASALAHFAFERGYSQEEVEELLTMRPNPNGKRPA